MHEHSENPDPPPLQSVRWLTLREIAEMWAPEARIGDALRMRVVVGRAEKAADSDFFAPSA